jgi:hypothetical protein
MAARGDLGEGTPGGDRGLQLHYLTPFRRKSGQAAPPADLATQTGTALAAGEQLCPPLLT